MPSLRFGSMKRTWSKLGGQLGLGCVAVGLVVIGLAWNGAASIDFVSGQMPYLLSGGALGLALVGVGVGMIVVQNSRRDRSIIETQLRDLSLAVTRLANAIGSTGAGNGHAPSVGSDVVVLGRDSYHRPECRLVAGKDLPEVSPATAVAEGLNPCRICEPAAPSRV